MAKYSCSVCGKIVKKPPSQWHPNYKCKWCYYHTRDAKGEQYKDNYMKILLMGDILKQHPKSKIFIRDEKDGPVSLEDIFDKQDIASRRQTQ